MMLPAPGSTAYNMHVDIICGHTQSLNEEHRMEMFSIPSA